VSVVNDLSMAKTLAGILAVSMAALLFAGCGDNGPKMSPAQKELQKKACDELNAKKKQLEATIKGTDWRARDKAETSLESNLKQRAEAGC
jgi:hypothetical protein